MARPFSVLAYTLIAITMYAHTSIQFTCAEREGSSETLDWSRSNPYLQMYT